MARKSKRSKAPKRNKQSFDEWYAAMFEDRWPELREALTRDPERAELREGLLKPYYLDESSLHVSRALEVRPGHHVLDMCAAPGGKTLVLALALDGQGVLIANDRSSARRARLHRVLDEHLPESLRRPTTVTAHDATRWGLYEQDTYDRILLDAPCSSERHIINSNVHLAKWTPARTRHLAQQAYAMLASAYLSAKPGGVILYSTCALSPLENDEVVGKLLKKKRADPLPLALPFGDLTLYGIQISPDRDSGRGPMYAAKIRKFVEA